MQQLSVETRIHLIEQQMRTVAQELKDEKIATERHREVVLERLGKQDKMFYMGLGIIAALQFIAPFILNK